MRRNEGPLHSVHVENASDREKIGRILPARILSSLRIALYFSMMDSWYMEDAHGDPEITLREREREREYDCSIEFDSSLYTF